MFLIVLSGIMIQCGSYNLHGTSVSFTVHHLSAVITVMLAKSVLDVNQLSME